MKTIQEGIPELGAVVCELYTLSLADGTAYYFNTSDMAVGYRGVTFNAGGLVITRGAIHSSVGVNVDSVEVTLQGQSEFNQLLAPAFARNGGFDGARILIERARADRVIHLFEGKVSDVTSGRWSVHLTVNSDLELLNIQMPRNVYQASCIHTLFDNGCTLSRESYAVTSLVTSGSTDNVILCDLAQTEHYFSLGVIEFTTGANAGVKRTVKTYSTGRLELSFPLEVAPSIGDGFKVFTGCNGTLERCNSFGNAANFRGFPFIPIPEESV